jgi:hypothetical protein
VFRRVVPTDIFSMLSKSRTALSFRAIRLLLSMTCKLLAIFTFLSVPAFSSGASGAKGPALKEISVPDDLSTPIDHLLDLTTPDNHERFQPALVETLLAFCAAPKEPDSLYLTEQRSGASSAFYQFELKISLARLLAYTYNPEIPGEAFLPSSVRLAHWREVNGNGRTFPKLWDKLSNLNEPFIVKGVEHIENTPDQTSGAYFDYDLDRLIILTKYHDNNVLISMSCQRGTSNVGKRGFILGSDNEWNYLYTGIKGVTRKGLGWVDSYMYNSQSIMIYHEYQSEDDSRGDSVTVRLSIFKWLKAGWAGINMVKPTHIHAGMDRYAKTLKRIIEDPALPDPHDLVAYYGPIDTMTPQQLRQEIRMVLAALRTKYARSKAFTDKRYAELFNSDQYVNAMSIEEMRAMLINQYTKKLIAR